ncbi:MAG: hypothetical protein WBA88_09175, partial [Pseudaminobacter sp.]
ENDMKIAKFLPALAAGALLALPAAAAELKIGVDLHFNLGLWHSARESYTPIETRGRGVSIGV